MASTQRSMPFMLRYQMLQLNTARNVHIEYKLGCPHAGFYERSLNGNIEPHLAFLKKNRFQLK